MIAFSAASAAKENCRLLANRTACEHSTEETIPYISMGSGVDWTRVSSSATIGFSCFASLPAAASSPLADSSVPTWLASAVTSST